MNNINDLELKAQIDQISKKIDSIVQSIENMAPKENEKSEKSDDQEQE